MKKNKKVAINTTFHVINCIMIFIIAALLKKISFIKHHDILGTILYTIIIKNKISWYIKVIIYLLASYIYVIFFDW